MYVGSLVFAQLMSLLPLHAFHRCVQRYDGHRYVKNFSCLDQFLCHGFRTTDLAREFARHRNLSARLGDPNSTTAAFANPPPRSTLADANETRDWRIFADFAQVLISQQGRHALLQGTFLPPNSNKPAYALDSTTIDLCLSLFPWAHLPPPQKRPSNSIRCWTCTATFPRLVIISRDVTT